MFGSEQINTCLMKNKTLKFTARMPTQNCSFCFIGFFVRKYIFKRKRRKKNLTKKFSCFCGFCFHISLKITVNNRKICAFRSRSKKEKLSFSCSGKHTASACFEMELNVKHVWRFYALENPFGNFCSYENFVSVFI